MVFPAWVDFLSLILLSPVLYLAGRAAQYVRLPLITGYVLTGIIVGPYSLGILSTEGLRALAVVDHGCLAIIAFSAGAELQMGDLRRIKKQVLCITLGICVATWAFVFVALLLMAPYLPMTAGLTPKQTFGVISLAATLMMARSPASMIAVLKETDGRGPYSSLVMAVVIVKDVLVFACFAVNIETSRVAMRKSEEGFALSHLAEPVVSLGLSLLLGGAFGVMIGRLMAVPSRPFNYVLKRLPPATLARVKAATRTAVVALLAMGVFWTAARLHAEPLLACMVAGVIVINRKGEAGSKAIHEELAVALAHLTPIVNMAFFSLAGASLILGRVAATLWAAVILWAVRVAGVYVGSWAGAKAAGAPKVHRWRVWQGMITQAGVAMGLAKVVGAHFSEWGPEFVFLMMSVIMMNLFAGPPLFRAAVISVGEARALQLPSQAGDARMASPRKQGDDTDDEAEHMTPGANHLDSRRSASL